MYIFKMASEGERSRNIKDLIHRALILKSRSSQMRAEVLLRKRKKLVDEMRSLRLR